MTPKAARWPLRAGDRLEDQVDRRPRFDCGEMASSHAASTHDCVGICVSLDQVGHQVAAARHVTAVLSVAGLMPITASPQP